MLDFVLHDADSFVLHHYAHFLNVRPALDLAQLNFDAFTSVRELDGVGDQVDQTLLHSVEVCAQEDSFIRY